MASRGGPGLRDLNGYPFRSFHRGERGASGPRLDIPLLPTSCEQAETLDLLH